MHKPSSLTHHVPRRHNRAEPEIAFYYAIVCDPQRERMASSGLTEKGFSVYAPSLRILRTLPRSTALCVIERPLFGRYLFAGWRGGDFPLGRIRGITGVEGYVRMGGKLGEPLSIPAKIVHAIMQRENEGEFDHTRVRTLDDYGIVEGQEMRVKSGPFASFPAKVRGLMKSGDAEIVLSLFGRAFMAELPVRELEAI